MFGPDSTIGQFTKGAAKGADDVPTGPGFIQKIKNIFSAEGTVGRLFGIFSSIGDTFSSVINKITNNPVMNTLKKVFGFAFKAGKAVAGVGGTLLGVIGKWFAPIGAIMAIFEGIMGFWDGFKSKKRSSKGTV